MELEIEAIHQTERLELVLVQLAGKTPPHLGTKLFGAIAQELAIIFVVTVDARKGRCGRR